MIKYKSYSDNLLSTYVLNIWESFCFFISFQIEIIDNFHMYNLHNRRVNYLYPFGFIWCLKYSMNNLILDKENNWDSYLLWKKRGSKPVFE